MNLKESTLFSTDQPCSEPKEDQFGFSPFAKQLAKAIEGFNDERSLVLALYGSWGSGKSTLINFIRHYLKGSEAENQQENPEVGDKKAPKPTVLDFNPWWFSGSEDLIRDFFVQLRTKLPLKSHQKLSDVLVSYADMVGHGLDAAGMTRGLGSLIGKSIKHQSHNIANLKDQIAAEFKQLDAPILVIIDDVDRLHPHEVCQLLTLVKALADFPKLVYLLAFDQQQVAAAIETELKMDGQRYLEKIIQVPFEIPAIAPQTLVDFFITQLLEIIKKANPPDELQDRNLWEHSASYLRSAMSKTMEERPPGLLSLIRVPRDVGRFINTFGFTYPSLSQEVYANDFWALEMLRVFVPDLYRQIRKKRKLLCAYPDNADAVKTLVEDNQERLQTINSDIHWDSLLRALFTATGGGEQAFRQRRLAYPEHCEPYFRGSLPDDALSREEIIVVLGSLSEGKEAFEQRLYDNQQIRLSNGCTQLSVLLGALKHYASEFTFEQVPILIKVLLDIGDDLRDPKDTINGFCFWSPHVEKIADLLGAALEQAVPRFDAKENIDEEQRQTQIESLKQTLTESIAEGNALACQACVLESRLGKANGIKTPHWIGEVEDSFVRSLRKRWVQKFQDKKQNPDAKAALLQPPDLSGMFRVERTFSKSEQAIEAVRKDYALIADTDEGLIKALASFITGTTKGEPSTFDREAIRQYLDVRAIEKRLRALTDQGSLTEQQQRVVDAFLQEIKQDDSP